MARATIRVLLIEDHPADTIFAQEALAHDPLVIFELAVAEDLRQGLAQLQLQPFDVLLLDLGLPDSQGLATFDRIHEQAPALPVVVLSGMLDEQFAVEAVQAGAQDYLVKGPAGWAMLARAIRYAIERQQARAALQASEQRFRALIEHSADAITMLSADGTILYEGGSVSELLGYQPEDMIGQSAFGFLHPEDQAANAALLGQVLAQPGKLVPWQARYRNQAGAWGWMEGTSVNLLGEPSVRAIVVNYRDVTARKQAEYDLQRSAERLTALHAIDRAILLADSLATIADTVLTHQRRLVPCKRASVLLFEAGASAATLLAVAADEWTEPAPGSRLPLGAIRLPDQFQRGEPYLIADLHAPEHRHYREILPNARSALLAPLIVRGELLGALNVQAATPGAFTGEHATILHEVGDMLALAIYNSQLLEREQHARQIAELLHTAGQLLARPITLDAVLETLLDVLQQIIPYDSANIMLPDAAGTFQVRYLRGYDSWSDPEAVRALAFTPSDMQPIGKIVATRQSNMIADTHQDPAWSPLPGTEHVRCWLGVPLIAGHALIGIYSVDRRAPNSLTADDARIAETLAAMAATAIERARLIAQLQDERAQLAQHVDERTADLRVANAELARAVRLKDEFLANMSHELRTPLNAILGRGEVLLEEIYGPINPRQRTALQGIDESGHHLLELINDILDLSKITSGKLELVIEETSVVLVCQASLRMIAQSALAKRITVTSQIDPAVDYLHADMRRLKQILVNLLSNAVKFTPSGGQIGLEVQGDLDQQCATFTVWDTGIGIAAEDMPRLFQPFTQIDSRLSRQYAGTGLGLALVRRLAEAHGGSVSLTSTPGQGSRFSVTLPWQRSAAHIGAAPAQLGAQTAPAAAAPVRTLGRRHALILLAEDNEQNSQMIQDYLQTHGYQVVVARDGVEVLARARELAPALILMDIQMPEMDGLEATARLRAESALRDIPIIALTALAMPGDRERSLAAGADDYLTKPVHLRTLLGMIEAHLQRRGAQTE